MPVGATQEGRPAGRGRTSAGCEPPAPGNLPLWAAGGSLLVQHGRTSPDSARPGLGGALRALGCRALGCGPKGGLLSPRGVVISHQARPASYRSLQPSPTPLSDACLPGRSPRSWVQGTWWGPAHPEPERCLWPRTQRLWWPRGARGAGQQLGQQGCPFSCALSLAGLPHPRALAPCPALSLATIRPPSPSATSAPSGKTVLTFGGRWHCEQTREDQDRKSGPAASGVGGWRLRGSSTVFVPGKRGHGACPRGCAVDPLERPGSALCRLGTGGGHPSTWVNMQKQMGGARLPTSV